MKMVFLNIIENLYIFFVEKERPQASKSRRNPKSLRRVNLASLLGKHIQNFNIDLEGVDVLLFNINIFFI